MVAVSGAAWHMTRPGARPCLVITPNGHLVRRTYHRGTPQGLLYPEFQHRPPPPSYQASMQEYRLRYQKLIN